MATLALAAWATVHEISTLLIDRQLVKKGYLQSDDELADKVLVAMFLGFRRGERVADQRVRSRPQTVVYRTPGAGSVLTFRRMTKYHTAMNSRADIVHFELAGPDEARLHTFYEAVLGWSIVPKGPGYALVETPDGSPNGAIVESEGAGSILGVQVADPAAVCEAVVAAGGIVLMAPTDNGWVVKALIQDPAGNVVSVIQAG